MRPMRYLQIALLAGVLAPGLLLAQQAVTNTPTSFPGQRAKTKYITTAATTNATLVSATPAVPYHFSLSNCSATVMYLRMYNLNVAPTCSSATGFVESIPIPTSSTSCGGRERPQELGQNDYTQGIAFCVTGGGGSTDNTAAVTLGYVTILYQQP